MSEYEPEINQGWKLVDKEVDPQEVLWGGPHGPGLVWTVQELSDSVKRNSKAIFGNDKPGLVERIGKSERAHRWTLVILVGQLIGILLVGGYIARMLGTA